MTGPQHAVKLAVGIAVGAVALIVGIILLVQFAIGAYASRSLKDDPAMSDAAVAKRLAAVAVLAVDPNAPPPAASPAPGSATGSGKSTFDGVCTACHATGVAGAPKLGDKAAWAPRLKAGKDALYNTALHGKGTMPPKGGNPALSDADVKAAVDYMVDRAK